MADQLSGFQNLLDDDLLVPDPRIGPRHSSLSSVTLVSQGHPYRTHEPVSINIEYFFPALPTSISAIYPVSTLKML